MIRKLACGLVAWAIVGSSPALADYPDRPITFIIPFSAGGSTDTAVRTLVPFLDKCLGSPGIAVRNVPGAGGDLGHAELAAAEPDGYTIGEIVTPNILVAMITKQPRYTLDSFVHLGTVFGSAATINVRRDNPINSLQDLVEQSKQQSLKMGLSAIGADDHLATLRLMKISGAKFDVIPLGDSATVPLALIRGDVDVAMTSLNVAARQQDQIKTLATSATKRAEVLPDAPTFIESGYDLTIVSQHGMGAPAGFPDEARDKLVACFQSIVADPAFLEEAKKRSASVSPLTPEETKASYEAEFEQLQELWKADPWIK